MPDFSAVAITGLALLITLTLARLSFGFLEKPILNFGHRFKYDTVASTGSESPVTVRSRIPSTATDGP